MSYIEKLVIEGFKSFKRKVSIPLLPGYTVFTGPNGSGKSNVSEAISFVLGIQSRSIRAKKAEELIFHGSQIKGASDEARIYLHINNSDKSLPLDREVVISRRINKSGVSTYKVNGKTVTRQEIVDILSQGRISPHGHNMIHQGDVTHIVEMDPTERRKIIDEISGILEYEEKKLKAQKELGFVAEKLREAEIILNERLQILERIKKDRDLAISYNELQKELELVRAALIWKEYTTAETDIGQIDEKIKILEKEVTEQDKEIKVLDDELEKEEKLLDNITTQFLKATDSIEVTKKLVRLRSDLEIKKDKLGSNIREIERIREAISRERGGRSFISHLKDFSGVKGVLADIISYKSEYNVAIQVAGGSHLNDIVVTTSDVGVKCVKHLKENRIGRARFLPLDKLKSSVTISLPKAAINWMSNLIQSKPEYRAVIDYVFATTACVKDADTANTILKSGNRVRMVTLDGDLFEASGAITGGYYKQASSGESRFYKEIEDLDRVNRSLTEEIEDLEIGLEKLSKQETKTQSISSEVKQIRFDERMKKFREKRKEAYENRLTLLQKLNEAKINRARFEAREDNIKVQWERYKDFEKDIAKLKEEKEYRLKEKQKYLVVEIDKLGPINLKAVDEFDSIRKDFDIFKEKFDKIMDEKNTVEQSVIEIEKKRIEVFSITQEKVNKQFKEIFRELTKGEAEIRLQDPNNLDSGLVISASPSGKRLLNIDSMSGGEKALTAIAFLFAIQRYKPSPFYILDEADAALDKVNSVKLKDLIKKQSKLAQFIVISHNDEVVRAADQIYGVSMEDGESRILGIKLPEE